MLVTPWLGTVNVSSLPVEEYVHVFVTLASPPPQTGSTAEAALATVSAAATAAPRSASAPGRQSRWLRADP